MPKSLPAVYVAMLLSGKLPPKFPRPRTYRRFLVFGIHTDMGRRPTDSAFRLAPALHYIIPIGGNICTINHQQDLCISASQDYPGTGLRAPLGVSVPGEIMVFAFE